MSVLVDVEALRHRYTLAARRRGHVELAPLIGVHRNTLETFVEGTRVSLRTLEAIHAWIEREEDLNGYTAVRAEQ